MTKVIEDLKDPYTHGFADYKNEACPVGIKHLEKLDEVFSAFEAGTLCVRFTDGDRKGSIARLKPIPGDVYSKPRIKTVRGWNGGVEYGLESAYRRGTLTWDGRKNKVQVFFGYGREEFEYLLDYDGPTVWEKFDAKAAKEQILENPEQKDIDGVELNIGDKVMFVNIRYGSATSLDRGTIKEFKVSVDSKRHEISTVIENEEGVLSTLRSPSTMVYRI